MQKSRLKSSEVDYEGSRGGLRELFFWWCLFPASVSFSSSLSLGLLAILFCRSLLQCIFSLRGFHAHVQWYSAQMFKFSSQATLQASSFNYCRQAHKIMRRSRFLNCQDENRTCEEQLRKNECFYMKTNTIRWLAQNFKHMWTNAWLKPMASSKIQQNTQSEWTDCLLSFHVDRTLWLSWLIVWICRVFWSILTVHVCWRTLKTWGFLNSIPLPFWDEQGRPLTCSTSASLAWTILVMDFSL